jgi:hypothetical protein
MLGFVLYFADGTHVYACIVLFFLLPMVLGASQSRLALKCFIVSNSECSPRTYIRNHTRKICISHPFPRIFNDLEKFVTSLVNTDLRMSPKLQKGALTAKVVTIP